MAFFAFNENLTPGQSPAPGGGGQNLTPGMGQYEEFYAFPGGGVTQQQDTTRWDEWMIHFQRPTLPPEIFGRAQLEGPTRELAETPEAQEQARRFTEQRQDRQRLVRLAREAGVNTDDPIAMGELWTQAVEAARATSVVEPDIDPWRILEGWAEEGAPGTLKREQWERERREQFFAEDPPDPYSITRTDEQVNLTDPQTARSLITRMLRDQLGREPDESEIRDFTGALNAHERANPTVTTTVEDYAYDADSGGVQMQNRSSTTEGGAGDPSSFADNRIGEEHEGERSAYTAGTEYFGVMEALTGSL